MQLLKRILTAVVLIPIVLALVLRAPVPAVALVAALVALLAVQELLKISEAYKVRPFHWPTYIFVGLFFLLLAINPGNAKPLLSTAIFVYSAGFAAAIALLRRHVHEDLKREMKLTKKPLFAEISKATGGGQNPNKDHN